MPEDVEDLSYRELAERLGVSLAAAKGRAKRQERRGRWTRRTGNAGEARFVIPAGDLDVAAPPSEAPHGSDTGGASPSDTGRVTPGALEALRGTLDAERARAERLERERDDALERAHGAEVKAARLEGQLDAERARKRPVVLMPRGARAVLARLARRGAAGRRD